MVVKLYFIVVLICIFLMMNDIKHIFMYLLAIYIPFEKFLFKFLAHFFILLLVFLVLSCKSSLCIVDAVPLPNT